MQKFKNIYIIKDPKVHVVSKIKIEKTLNVKIVNNGFCKEFVSLKFKFDTFF